MRVTRRIRWFCLSLSLALVALAALGGGAWAAPAAPAAGDLAPDRVGTTLDGEPVLLSSFAGKVVVVSFWATWCPYCLKELPILENIQNVGNGNLIQVIAVNTEERAVFRKALRALESFKMKLAYDPGEASAKAYGVKGIPHLLIIGRDGRIVQVYRGYDESSLDGIVADLNAAVAAARPASSAPL
jgi:thiol-disulfide isomerase/thioredoxin